MEDKEIIIDGINISECEYFKLNRGFNCYKGYSCTDKECSNCYYKQLKRLEQENAKQKEMIERQWKLLEQCGVSAGGELKRVSYLIRRLRDENKLNMSSVFNLSIELQKALDENARLKEENYELNQELLGYKKGVQASEIIELKQTLQEIKTTIAEAPKPFIIDFSETKTATEVEYNYAAVCNELEVRLYKVLELITKAEEE